MVVKTKFMERLKKILRLMKRKKKEIREYETQMNELMKLDMVGWVVMIW